MLDTSKCHPQQGSWGTAVLGYTATGQNHPRAFVLPVADLNYHPFFSCSP